MKKRYLLTLLTINKLWTSNHFCNCMQSLAEFLFLLFILWQIAQQYNSYVQTFWNLTRLLGRNSHWVFGHTATNSCLINSASAEDLEWKVGFSRTINLLKLVKPNNFFLHISRLVLTSLLTLFQYKGSQSLQHWGVATLTRNCFTRNRQGLSCFCSRITPSRIGRLFVRHHATNGPYFCCYWNANIHFRRFPQKQRGFAKQISRGNSFGSKSKYVNAKQ